jgi:hypothetical protein
VSKIYAALPFLASLSADCVTSGDGSDSLVDRPRILDVVSTPAELAPGEPLHLLAVVASPDGPLTPALRWSFCSTPRAPSDNTAVSASCAGRVELPFGSGEPELDSVVPRDACARFGSETPAGRAGIRADLTGGYYQPVRVALGDEISVARVRIRCALPSAPIAAARSYATDYRNNVAPSIAAVRGSWAGAEVDLAALPRTGEVVLRIEAAPGAHESFLVYDVHSGALSSQLERLSATWFVSHGSFVATTTELAADSADNTWRADPDAASDVWVWIVLRDDRGGSSVLTRTLHFSR